jgi:hypothetical protein
VARRASLEMEPPVAGLSPVAGGGPVEGAHNRVSQVIASE